MTKDTLWVLIFATCLPGCYPKKSKTETEPVAINRSIELSLETTVFELSALPDSIEIKMTNNDVRRITTGRAYRIEIFENDQWRDISPNIIFVDIGYELKPTQYQYFEEDFYKGWINYKKGRYRIVKEYTKPDYPRTRKRYESYVEFDIK